MAGPADNNLTAEEVWRIYWTTGHLPDFLGSPWYMSKAFRRLSLMGLLLFFGENQSITRVSAVTHKTVR